MFFGSKTNSYLIVIPLISLLLVTPLVVEAGIADIVYFLVTSVFGLFMTVGGILLNLGISEFVIGFGKNFGTGNVGNTINQTWTIVRDIFNITFIFGLVYLGFKMILNSEDADTRRWLIHLLMAAVLVNFSLLITKSIIEVGNLVSTEVVKSSFVNSADKVNVSDTFKKNMGINSLYDSGAVENSDDGSTEEDATWAMVFGSMIVLLVGTFVFAAGGLMLIIRGAVLVLYMILSPFMFIGWVFPQLQKYTDMYWRGFLGRVFFAPIFILLLYISSAILAGYQVGLGNAAEMGTQLTTGLESQSDTQNVDQSFLNSFMPFILGSVFLVASLVVAARMGADGGNAAVGAGKKFGNKIRSRAGQATRFGARIAASPVTVPAGWAAAGAKKGVKKASYNLGTRLNDGFTNFQSKERTGAIGKAVTSASKWNAVDRAVRGRTEAMKNNKAGTNTTEEQDKLYRQKTEERVNQKRAVDEAENIIDGNIKEKEATAEGAKNLNTAFKDLAETMRKMTKDDKLDLGYEKLKKESFAINLKDGDIEHFEKSGKFSAQQIQGIKKARKEGIMKTIKHGSVADKNPNSSSSTVKETQTANLFRGSVNDIAKMPTDVFTQAKSYKHLTPAMVEAKMKEGVSSDELDDMKAALTAHTLMAPENESQVWDKWKDSNSVHAAKFFS